MTRLASVSPTLSASTTLFLARVEICSSVCLLSLVLQLYPFGDTQCVCIRLVWIVRRVGDFGLFAFILILFILLAIMAVVYILFLLFIDYFIAEDIVGDVFYSCFLIDV